MCSTMLHVAHSREYAPTAIASSTSMTVAGAAYTAVAGKQSDNVYCTPT